MLPRAIAMIYVCPICGYKYDENAEGVAFADLPSDWLCPLCNAPKSLFESQEAQASAQDAHPAARCETVDEPSAASFVPQTAAEVLMDALAARGLKWVLGMVGHSNLGVADAVRKLSATGRLNFVGIRHEGAAAFAAAAYGKLTGRPAACLTIAGPGATNLLTGLWDARLDGAPVLALTGQIESSALGLYLFQEIDLAAAFKSLVCAQYTLFANAPFAKLAADAYDNAVLNGGVAQLILPDDVQTLTATAAAPQPPRPLEKCSAPCDEDIAEAVRQLREAKAPVVVIGEGARRAVSQALTLADVLRAPVFTTYRAKGFVPDTHPLSCGVIGRSGNAVSAHFFAHADAVVALGVGFSKHSGLTAKKITVQIDRHLKALGLRAPVTCGLLGDVGETLDRLIPVLEKAPSPLPDPRPAVAAQWEAWRAEKRTRAAKSRPGALSPAEVCAVLGEKIPENAIISVDVGNVAYAFGRYFEAKHQQLLLSWYLGSIGVGLPAALGAWCATQEKDSPWAGRTVFAVVGDGGLGQYLAEWTTAVKYAMNLKCVVFNNSELAKISREQEAAKMPVWRTELVNPNFADYATSCGALGIRVSVSADLRAALDAALKHPGPALVEVLTDPSLT